MNSRVALKTAVIRYVMETMGFFFDPKLIQSRLIMNADTLIPQTLRVEVDGTPTKKSCWCAELAVATSTFRAIVVDLTDGEIREFAVVFRFGENPAYGMRISSDPLDEGSYLFKSENGKWTAVPTLLQATSLVAIEKLSEVSMTWKKPASYEDMFDNLVSFLRGEI